MKTYEVVAIANYNGKTYRTGDMYYNRENGFHESNGKEWDVMAWQGRGGLNDFINEEGWKVCELKKMTIEEIEEILGCKIEIIK